MKFGLKTLSKLTQVKKDSPDVLKPIIFLVLLGVVAVVSIIWYVKQKGLEESKAVLEIRKKRLKEAEKIIQNSELERSAKRGYKVIFEYVKKQHVEQEKKLKLIEASLEEVRKRIKEASTWEDLENA